MVRQGPRIINGSEGPFLIARGLALAIFLMLGVIAAKKFRPAPGLKT
jgi:hypothetical protein